MGQFISSQDYESKGDMYLIYGEGGTGKTTIVTALPGNKIIIPFDLSLNHVSQDFEHTLIYEMDDNEKAQIIEFLPSFLAGYATKKNVDAVVLDNVSVLYEMALAELKALGLGNYDAYPKLQNFFLQLAMQLRNLGKLVYVTAHEAMFDESDPIGNTISRFQPLIKNDVVRNNFLGLFDVIGRATAENDEYRIQLVKDKQVYAKNRLDKRHIINPEDLFNSDAPDLGKVDDDNLEGTIKPVDDTAPFPPSDEIKTPATKKTTTKKAGK